METSFAWLRFSGVTSASSLTCPLSAPQIYLINLRRRADRRERMLLSLNELEVDVKVVDAVDGK